MRPAVSCMTTRHNLGAYEAAGLDWHHVPVGSTERGSAALDELLPFLKRELRRAGAIAVHGNRHTDFVAALGAAHLHHARGIDPAEGLRRAEEAGLTVTPEACACWGSRWGRFTRGWLLRGRAGRASLGQGQPHRRRPQMPSLKPRIALAALSATSRSPASAPATADARPASGASTRRPRTSSSRSPTSVMEAEAFPTGDGPADEDVCDGFGSRLSSVQYDLQQAIAGATATPPQQSEALDNLENMAMDAGCAVI